MFYIGFFIKKIRYSLIPSFLMSDVNESLRLLTKNERMSESLVFFNESLICSFFRKKRAIRSEKPMSKFPALIPRDNSVFVV